MQLRQFIATNRLTILSFLLVGALAAAINFATFSLCLQLASLDYSIAASIAYVLSVVFHFLANRQFTFKQTSGNLSQQLPKYLSLVLLNYLTTLFVMYLIVELLQLSPYLANLTAIGVTVGTGYMLSRYWIFTD